MYLSQKVYADGVKFQSDRELQQYRGLRHLQQMRLICDLEVHPKFAIVMNGVFIDTYFISFRYREVVNRRGTQYKNVATPITQVSKVYWLKKMLVEAQYGIVVDEI